MSKFIRPKKLSKGNHIRVIAPSRSISIISPTDIKSAVRKLESMGFSVTFGKHVKEKDIFNSSSVESRIEDVHEAFSDKSVDAIFSAIGGYNANQLLNYLDYNLIAKNPKILCGFSDITVLGNAITAKTGLITYIGPHFSSWAMKHGFEYSQDHFVKCCMSDQPFDLLSSETWSDDPWYLDQEKRDFIKNEGYWTIQEGKADGRLIGGHVRCLNALQGTQYWPELHDSILLLEEDAEIFPALFDRQLQTIIHQKDFGGVKGILIGRFQKDSKINRNLLEEIISTKRELKDMPIIANVNLGHTTPIATFPIGGTISIDARDSKFSIKILEH